MKKAIQIIVASILSVPSFAQSSTPADVEPNTPTSAIKAFRDAIQDPDVRVAYRELYSRLASAPTDYEMLQFLRFGNPFLAQMFSTLEVLKSRMIDDFSKMAQTNMTRVEPGITHQYDLYYSNSRQNGLDLGLSDQAIENFELYIAGGGLNAYTVSADDERIIVVMQSEMFEKLTPNEMRAVGVHEYAHNIFFHSIQREQILFFLNVIGNLMTTPKIPGAQNIVMPNKFELKLSDKFFAHLTATGDSQMMAASRHAKAIEAEGNQVLMQAFYHLQSLPEAERNQIIQEFLVRLLSTMQAMNANPESIRYFNSILNNMKAFSQIALSPTEYSYHMKEAYMAASRSHELTCDFMAGTIVDNSALASSFGKLSGLDFKSSDRAKVLEHYQKQAQKFLMSHSPEEASPYMGSTHTAPILRINDILSIPRYPSIGFANRMMRLLLVDKSITELEEEFKIMAENFEKDVDAKDTATHENETVFEQWAHRLASPFVHKSRPVNPYKARLENLHKRKLRNVQNILRLVEQIGLEREINPRFSNIIEYYTMDREILLEQLRALELQLGTLKGKSPQQAMYLSIIVQNLKSQIETPTQILSALKVAIEKRLKDSASLSNNEVQTLNDRLKLVTTTLQSQNIQELMSARKMASPQHLQQTYAGRFRIPEQNPYMNQRCLQALTKLTQK